MIFMRIGDLLLQHSLGFIIHIYHNLSLYLLPLYTRFIMILTSFTFLILRKHHRSYGFIRVIWDRICILFFHFKVFWHIFGVFRFSLWWKRFWSNYRCFFLDLFKSM